LRDLAFLILSFWLGGTALLAGLTLHPVSRPRVQGLWPLMFSEAAILFIGVTPWFVPTPALGALLAIAAVRIGYESGHVNGMGAPYSATTGAAIMLGIWALAWFAGSIGPLAALTATSIGIGYAAIALLRAAPLALVWRLLLFPLIPLGLFIFAASWPEAGLAFLTSFLLVEIFDSFSLLGGRLFGSRKLAPKLSPGKTWEGLATGLAATLGSAALISLLMPQHARLFLLLALLSPPAAIAGDLAASAAKRRAGVKDYPAILPIQGGLLDIMDAWIVAGPLAAFASLWLGM
jgi:phosphatidate cytidylyltransferase